MAIEDLSTGAGTTPLGLSENTERLYNPPNQPQDQVKMWQMRFIIDDLQRVIKALADLGVQVNTDLLTNKGDLLTHDSTSDTILPIGTNEYILSVDTSTSTSLAYISKAAVVDGGLTVADTDTVDLTKTVAQITAAVRMQMSITSDVNGVKLSGDATTPGNSRYYGTDGTGTKGFYALPAAGGESLAQTLVIGNTSSGTDIVVSAGDDIIINNTTASRIAGIGASKEVVSLDTATYPSLAELAFVKGATSNIQTQINNIDSLGNLVVDTDYLDFSNPNLNFSTRSKSGVNIANFLNMD